MHTFIKLTCLILIACGTRSHAMDADRFPGKESGERLIQAAKEGYRDRLIEEIRLGADVNYEDQYRHIALTWAAKNGQVDCVQVLIQAKATINHGNNAGWTALMWAAANGNIDCVRELIEAGATIDQKNDSGNTALTFARRAGHRDVYEMLKNRSPKERCLLM